ncbi:MAG: DUF1538 domain-containing protein [Pseudomonadota bacterium]
MADSEIGGPAHASAPQSQRLVLGTRDTFRVLWPYVQRNFLDQLSGIWFIVAYLIIFQLLVLKLPIVFASMIAVGIFVVVMGLMFFMEGLRLGLMPLGEVIGSIMPKKSSMPLILLFAFLLGAGATFAEPAIAVLKAAGSTLLPDQAPLLYSLLNDFSGQLVSCVGVGVGLAVLLGVLRFFYAWPLKYLAIPAVSLLLVLSYAYSRIPELSDVLGLAWDCGAVTTGPVTVPLVLALGIGVCRVVNSGSGSGGNSGFGIVTLASLFPILAVLLLAGYHYAAGDYYGADNYRGEVVALGERPVEETVSHRRETSPITSQEFQTYLQQGQLPEGYDLEFTGGEPQLVDGKIVVTQPDVVIRKEYDRPFQLISDRGWDTEKSLLSEMKRAGLDALRAIIPLCLFLYIVLRMLGQALGKDSDVSLGVGFALIGMALFGLGIALGLTPLGGQLGSNVPLAFAEIVPWGAHFSEGALHDPFVGKLVAVAFAFLLGYGATLAEPALNALGDTVQKITAGAFRKRLLMQSVAFGVGCGIAAGVVKMAFGLSLISLLIPAYSLVLVLTWFAPNDFVNFSWDSAGVTTGPITVPLVLAMGLGIGANVPGVSDGFGILALASVGPILTVLTVGLYTQRMQRLEGEAESSESESGVDDDQLEPVRAGN